MIHISSLFYYLNFKGDLMANMWMVRAGRDGVFYDDFKKLGLISIGFVGLGDLTNKNSEDIKQLVLDTYPDYTNSQIGVQSSQVNKFVNEFQIDDYVISFSSKKDMYLVGKIISGYYHSCFLADKREDFTYLNFRDVEWLGEIKKFNLADSTTRSLRSATTIFKINDDAKRDILAELSKSKSYANKIDWVDFYTEFADKLLEFKNNRQELIEKIRNVYADINIKLPSLECDEQNNIIVPYDIDPFTVFALFNKQITDKNRINLLNQIKKEFSINAQTPNDFYGIPLVNNMSATFYYFSVNRGENDIDNLWEVFTHAIRFCEVENALNRENFIKYYDEVLKQKGVKWNLTMALFWIRPNKFISLDVHNRNILSVEEILSADFKNEIRSLKEPPSGEKYLKICKDIDLAIKQSNKYSNFADFSHKAYYSDKFNQENEKSGIGDEDVETVRYWLYAPGEGAYKWDEFSAEGIMAIGWNETGNLKNYYKKDQIKSKLQELYQDKSSHKNDVHALWQFANEIQIGDIIFAKRGMSDVIGMGIVESDYEFSTDYDFYHVRKVNWIKKDNKPYDGKLPMKTLTDITIYTEMVNKIKELVDGIDEPPEPTLLEYPHEKFLEEVYVSEEDYETLVSLVKNKKNLIVQGAPGVGKTFMAKRLAYSIMGVKDVERVMMVQFHQSYSYEDFVMGYRPYENGFKLKNGSFYKFCKKAEEDSDNDYFFIIDEINRGNLSKIFGELFMLIENDKRGEKNKIQLLYSDELFFIPKNVHIIGLMNTADRSLAMIDYALRRRFAFFDLKPGFESDGFKDYQQLLSNDNFDRLVEVMLQLNETIKDDESLGEGFRIGHSYLCNIKEEDADEKLKYIVEYELIPLLSEYWFDEPDKVEEWSGKLRSVVDDSIRDNLY